MKYFQSQSSHVNNGIAYISFFLFQFYFYFLRTIYFAYSKLQLTNESFYTILKKIFGEKPYHEQFMLI